jgi:hypothetical protein
MQQDIEGTLSQLDNSIAEGVQIKPSIFNRETAMYVVGMNYSNCSGKETWKSNYVCLICIETKNVILWLVTP